jgi:hypothetical protein
MLGRPDSSGAGAGADAAAAAAAAGDGLAGFWGMVGAGSVFFVSSATVLARYRRSLHEINFMLLKTGGTE